jgi:TPR repeat protein
MNQLGALGLRPDPAVAADWYRKAAALGNPAAEVRLQTLRVEAAR